MTVIDESDISELQRAGAGTRHQIGEIARQFVKILFGNVVDRRRDEATATQRDSHTDMDSRRRLEPLLAPKSVELAEALSRNATAFNCSTAGSARSVIDRCALRSASQLSALFSGTRRQGSSARDERD